MNGVTISGYVKFDAIDLGTPTWLIFRLGSPVMTVRAKIRNDYGILDQGGFFMGNLFVGKFFKV